jgi:outer membrane protein assembly factor BamB
LIHSWRSYRWFGVVLSVSLLAGCSWFTWLPWVDDPDDEKDKDEPAKLVKFEHEIKLDRLWRAKIGEGLGKKYLRLEPAIVADRIIATDGYGHVEARDRFSGKRIWRTKTHSLREGFISKMNFIDRTDPSFVGGGVGVGEGLALLGTTNGEVVALDVADGSLRWTAELGSEVLSTPSADGGLVFAQTIDGRLLALNVADGSTVWTYDNQVPILTLRGTSSPLVQSDIVFAGFANGKIIAFRTGNGEPIWEHRVMLPEGRSELERMVDIDAQPLMSNGAIFISAYHGPTTSISARDGRPRWEQKVSSHLDLAEGYGQVYVVNEDDHIVAMDQESGEINWTQEDFENRVLTAPLAFSNYVLVGDDAGYLHVIAQRDGRHLGRRKLDRKGLRSDMIVEDSTVYVLDNSGGLHALEIEQR